MPESLDIIRSARHSPGRVGFDIGNGVTDWIMPDECADYVDRARRDPAQWKIVAVGEVVRRLGVTWEQVATSQPVRDRIALATAETPTEARVTVR